MGNWRNAMVALGLANEVDDEYYEDGGSARKRPPLRLAAPSEAPSPHPNGRLR